MVIGSEGTLGIVTEVGADPAPPESIDTLLAAFDSTDAAGNAVSRIIAAGVVPAAVEMMDALAIQAGEAGGARRLTRLAAALLVELDGAERRGRPVRAGQGDLPRAATTKIRSRRTPSSGR